MFVEDDWLKKKVELDLSKSKYATLEKKFHYYKHSFYILLRSWSIHSLIEMVNQNEIDGKSEIYSRRCKN